MIQKTDRNIKKRKSSIKIPRKAIVAKKLHGQEANYTHVRIKTADISKILKKSHIKLIVGSEKQGDAALRLTVAINEFIRNWLFQQTDTTTLYIEWAQNIADAADLLLTCMGKDSKDFGGEIPLETKYNLLFESAYSLESNPRTIHKLAKLPDCNYRAIEQAGKGVSVIKEMALEAVKGYSRLKTQDGEYYGKRRRKPDLALAGLFMAINDVYRIVTGKTPKASNGDDNHSGGKGYIVRFASAFLIIAVARIKESEKKNNEEISSFKAAEYLESFAKSDTKITRLVHRGNKLILDKALEDKNHREWIAKNTVIHEEKNHLLNKA